MKRYGAGQAVFVSPNSYVWDEIADYELLQRNLGGSSLEVPSVLDPIEFFRQYIDHNTLDPTIHWSILSTQL